MYGKYLLLYEQAKTLPIRDVLEHFKINSRSAGHISCPFRNHPEDSTPSLKIYFKTDSFFCFGCKAAGSSIFFIKHKLGCSLNEALDYFEDNFDVHVYSKAKTFNKIRNKIAKSSNHLEKSVILNTQEDNFLILITILNKIQLTYFDSILKSNDLSLLFFEFDSLTVRYINDIIGKEDFLLESSLLFEAINTSCVQWKTKEFVVDAEKTLRQIELF